MCMTLKVMEDEPHWDHLGARDWRAVGGSAGTPGSGQIGRQVGKRQPSDVLRLAVCRSSLCVSLFHCELKCKAGPENVGHLKCFRGCQLSDNDHFNCMLGLGSNKAMPLGFFFCIGWVNLA